MLLTSSLRPARWLDLHDIKDFYETAVITNHNSWASSNWTGNLDIVHNASSSAMGDDTNLIVLIHGINADDWHWINASETVFKRLVLGGVSREIRHRQMAVQFSHPAEAAHDRRFQPK